MPLLTAKRVDDRFGLDVTDEQGHVLRIDIPVDQGGGGSGFRPMQTMLAALCGCSSVDVMSILSKQRQPLEHLSIDVDGEREEGVDLAVWKRIDLVFRVTGAVDPAKACRAVTLSIEKYCSVAETLRRAGAEIRYRVEVNGAEVSPT